MPRTSSVPKTGTLIFAVENAPASAAIAMAGAAITANGTATTAIRPINGIANTAITPKIGKASNNASKSIILHLLFFIIAL
jgi:hypothetical protein